MLKIGVDIEDISRFVDKSDEFLTRIFTDLEIQYCKSHKEYASRFTARYCAKEAIVKALSGFGIKNIAYKDIEVFHDENKCPCARILKPIEKDLIINLSLSHEKEKAIAFVTIEA
ncbi:MAG: holo-ACP synthase [Candidatus Gastranaerophilales bacterium]